MISRHRHSGGVHAWVEGSYIFEPPGETHTLVVPEGCTEMGALFQVNGSLIYVDPQGTAIGYEDVFTRIEKARAHYASVGLGEQYVEQFIRSPTARHFMQLNAMFPTRDIGNDPAKTRRGAYRRQILV